MQRSEKFDIRPIGADDSDWVATFLAEHWYGPTLVTRGCLHNADELSGFVAQLDGKTVGLLTYRADGDGVEIVSLNSLSEGLGVGTELLKSVMHESAKAQVRRLWAVVSNDNLNALRFFQTRGFVVSAWHRNAMEEARDIMPEIPTHGFDNIPMRDEIEVEMRLE